MPPDAADEIVVFAEPMVESLSSGSVWTAQLPHLSLVSGLWATKGAALEGLYVAFRQWVQWERQAGTLESWLRESGVTWGYTGLGDE